MELLYIPTGVGSAFLGGSLVLMILFFALLPFIAIIALLLQEGKSGEKLIWFFAILFLPILGTLLYFAVGRKRIRNS